MYEKSNQLARPARLLYVSIYAYSLYVLNISPRPSYLDPSLGAVKRACRVEIFTVKKCRVSGEAPTEGALHMCASAPHPIDRRPLS